MNRSSRSPKRVHDMKDKIIEQIKDYMYHIAYHEYNHTHTTDEYDNQIEYYRVAVGTLLDLCDTMNIDLSDVSVRYCGYDIDVDDICRFSKIWEAT